MKRNDIVFLLLWGNIIGFALMRILGIYYDSRASGLLESKFTDFFALIIFIMVIGAPGAYYYAKDTMNKNEYINPIGMALEVFIYAGIAFLGGILGVISGRIL